MTIDQLVGTTELPHIYVWTQNDEAGLTGRGKPQYRLIKDKEMSRINNYSD